MKIPTELKNVLREAFYTGVVLWLVLSLAGCSVSAAANITIGHPNKPSVNQKVIERFVCRGEFIAAESLMLDKGYDHATAIETIENAKIKCEKNAN
jgi:hypothetical protein